MLQIFGRLLVGLKSRKTPAELPTLNGLQKIEQAKITNEHLQGGQGQSLLKALDLCQRRPPFASPGYQLVTVEKRPLFWLPPFQIARCALK